MSGRTLAVTLPEGTWASLYALALEQAWELAEQDDRAALDDVAGKLLPVLGAASGSAELRELEAKLRKASGRYVDPSVRRAAAELVREV